MSKVDEVAELITHAMYEVKSAKQVAMEICQLKDRGFLDWLIKHGTRQQVELFKKEWGI